MSTQSMSEKFTRKQLEEKLGLSGKEATAEIRQLLRRGGLQYQMDPVDPFKSKALERTYFFVAKTAELIQA